MVLHVETQNQLFELFHARYTEAVEAAKRKSAFDFGVEEIRARNIHHLSSPEILFVDLGSGAKTMLHELEGEVDVVRRSFDAAREAAKLGFYRNHQSEKIYAATPHWDMETSQVYLLGVRGQKRSIEASELKEKYEKVLPPQVKDWWEAEFARTPATEARRYYLLSGAIFPIYDKVMGASGIQSVKIARASLADGQALVGLNLSPEDVPQVKERLGIGTPLSTASVEEIVLLLKGKSIIELDNGWRLLRGKISGDAVIELSLNGTLANRDELLAYGFTEEIVRFKRRWFVVQENAVQVLSKLLAHRKAIRDLTAGVSQ
jgi:hypothetical protein